MKSWKQLLALAVISAIAVCVSGEKLNLKARFDGYRVYSLNISNSVQLSVLQELEQIGDGYQFWESPHRVDGRVVIQVPPHKLADFSDLVNSLDFDFELMIVDLQNQFDLTKSAITPRADFDLESYQRLFDIYAWFDDLALNYPGVVTKIHAGRSHEGRPIDGVKVSFKAGNKGIFLETGMHAREWIGVATGLYILNQLLTSDDPEIHYIAQNYDWYIVPVTNPDGYEYTHTTNRNWRKTRYPHTATCYGADPNRNWDYQWGVAGTSTSACSDTYGGPGPFSEIETKTLSDYYRTIASDITLYLSFHSFSQILLLPFGHTTDHLANYDDAMQIGRAGLARLTARHGTQYTIGNIAEAIYPASGGSIDWIKGDQFTPLSFCFELRDTGRYGFVLPPDQIVPTGEETLDGIIGMLDEAVKLGY